MPSSLSGDLHYWIYVIWKLKTVFKEDKEESQNHEWKGNARLYEHNDNSKNENRATYLLKGNSPSVRARTSNHVNTLTIIWLLSKERIKLNSIKQVIVIPYWKAVRRILIRCMVLQALKRWCTQILSALKWVSLFPGLFIYA